MLSGEGNENGGKTTIGLISKKQLGTLQHTFFLHFFAVALHDYRNFRNSLFVLPFLLFLTLYEDQICGFVLVTWWVHMRNPYIEECCFSSWRYYCFSVNQHEGRVRCVSVDPKTRGDRAILPVFQVRIFLTLLSQLLSYCSFIVRSHFSIDREAVVPSLPYQVLCCCADEVAMLEYPNDVVILPVCGSWRSVKVKCLLMSER